MANWYDGWWLFSRTSDRERELQKQVAELTAERDELKGKLLIAEQEGEDLAISNEKYRNWIKDDAALAKQLAERWEKKP